MATEGKEREMNVRLTWPEAELATIAGTKRRLLALHDQRPEIYGNLTGDTWGEDIESAGAELAVAKTLGQFWTAWARRPGQVTADVGTNIGVRRRRSHGTCLIVHPRDPDDHLFVLVSGNIPDFTLEGWISARQAKTTEYGDPFGTGRPAYWIEQQHLNPISTLIVSAGRHAGQDADMVRTNGVTSRGTAHVEGSEGSDKY